MGNQFKVNTKNIKAYVNIRGYWVLLNEDPECTINGFSIAKFSARIINRNSDGAVLGTIDGYWTGEGGGDVKLMASLRSPKFVRVFFKGVIHYIHMANFQFELDENLPKENLPERNEYAII